MKKISLIIAILSVFLFSCTTTKVAQNTPEVVTTVVESTNNVPEYESEEADSSTKAMILKELEDNMSSQLLSKSAPLTAVTPYPNDIKHIFIITSFENNDYSSVIAQAPYMVSLANQGALFTNFFSLGHPSQPNYFRFFAGISLVTNNNDPGFQVFSQKNLYTQVLSVNKTFESYIEGLPSAGYTGFQTGTYYGKHDAPRAFSNVNQTVRKPFTLLPSNLDNCATIVYLVPDINNSGHDTNIPYADNWLKNNSSMQRIIAYCGNPSNKSILINTWDEGSATDQIFVSMYGYKVIPGVKITKTLNQYDLVNMIVDIYGAARINTAASRTERMDGWFVVDTTTSTTVDCPTQFYPTNSSSNIAPSVVLTWAGNTSFVTGYNVYFGTTSNPPIVSSNQCCTTYTPTTNLNNGTTYYWKVVPLNGTTQASNCVVNQFSTTVVINPPGCSTNNTPTTGSTNVSLTPTLSWTAGNGTTTGYNVYFGTSNPPPQVVTNQTTTTYKPNTLTSKTSYYWKVVPLNGTTQASNCVVNQFTTLTVVVVDTCTKEVVKTVSVLKDSTYQKQIVSYVDTTVKVSRDSSYIVREPTPCNSVDPTDTTWFSNYKSTYVTQYFQIVGNKTLEDALIRDCIAKHFNVIHCYDASTANYSNMAKLNARLRNEAGVKEITAVTQGSSEVFGWIKTYNSLSDDAGDFDAVNFEYEPWNGGTNMTTMWANNKLWLSQVHTQLNTIPLDHNYDYFGWWLAPPMIAEAPSELVKNTSAVLLHCYRTIPEWPYLETRCNDINTAAIAQNKIVNLIVIFSSEPAFMQNWLKTHTLEEALAIIKVGFDSKKYSNIRLTGYLNFTLDFLRVAQPTPPASPLALGAPLQQFRSIGIPMYSASGFKNETTQKSLDMVKYDPTEK